MFSASGKLVCILIVISKTIFLYDVKARNNLIKYQLNIAGDFLVHFAACIVKWLLKPCISFIKVYLINTMITNHTFILWLNIFILNLICMSPRVRWQVLWGLLFSLFCTGCQLGQQVGIRLELVFSLVSYTNVPHSQPRFRNFCCN